MLRLATLAMLSLLGLAGCAALSPFSELTKLDLTLEGSNRLNPDLHDRPSPIVVRLIGLKHPVAFENSDFFSLYQQPKEALAPDYVIQEELELRPGETRTLQLHVTDDTRYLGVLAAYRNLPDSTWHLTLPLEDQARNSAHLRLGEQGLALVDPDADSDSAETRP